MCVLLSASATYSASSCEPQHWREPSLLRRCAGDGERFEAPCARASDSISKAKVWDRSIGGMGSIDWLDFVGCWLLLLLLLGSSSALWAAAEHLIIIDFDIVVDC